MDSLMARKLDLELAVTALSQGELKEDIYIAQPEGFHQRIRVS